MSEIEEMSHMHRYEPEDKIFGTFYVNFFHTYKKKVAPFYISANTPLIQHVVVPVETHGLITRKMIRGSQTILRAAY